MTIFLVIFVGSIACVVIIALLSMYIDDKQAKAQRWQTRCRGCGKAQPPHHRDCRVLKERARDRKARQLYVSHPEMTAAQYEAMLTPPTSQTSPGRARYKR